jgi:subtilisin family serine protease
MVEQKILMRAPKAPERAAAQGMTGRYLVAIKPGASAHVSSSLSNLGIVSAQSLTKDARSAKALPDGHHISLGSLDIALVDPTPDQEDGLHDFAASDANILSVEPERICHAFGVEAKQQYLAGWRDGVVATVERALSPGVEQFQAAMAAKLADTDAATWGLIATGVVSSRFSGAGIKLAVLDTGFDLNHPDFANRQITTSNFVGDGSQFHDGVGHGTHCVGTAAGPLHPKIGRRYGIAYEAQIFVGRVLDDMGSGGDFNILQGINWAIENGCQIISMSLGSHWFVGDPPFSNAYETAAQRALSSGCLIIAAAGNDGEDPQFVGAVPPPGNSPSAVTVAAVDSNFATAPFSDGARPEAPGVKGPDIAGPGVNVYSSWLVDEGGFKIESGTSMATPHVAGIAALFAQSDPNLRGQALKDAILNGAKALDDNAARVGDIGRGLVQAPVAVLQSAIPAKSRGRNRRR